MFRTTLHNFRALRTPVRAMVYLHWIYGVVGALTSTFVQIFLYRQFDSLSFNVIGLIVYFIGCALGFSLVGAVVARYRGDMKWGYIYAFVILCVSFIFLFGTVSMQDALLFMFTNGFGLGLYWVTLHTFELTETKNQERDYYSSVLSAGDQIIDLLAPALAALLFVLSSDVFGLGTFTLLFIVAPLIYLSGLPLFRHVRSYRPHPVERADVRHFFRNRKNQHAQVYLFAGSANFALSRITIPIVAILFLGSETNVGLFNALFAIISAVALMYLTKHRHTGNRLHFLFYTSLVSAAIALLLAFNFTLVTFMLFSLLSVIVRPLQRVSAHVIDLETMETLGREGRDFFPTMIMRDAVFGVWRVLALIALWIFLTVATSAESGARIALIALAASTMLTYVGATLLYKK
jgi:YQGE family putative transporter